MMVNQGELFDRLASEHGLYAYAPEAVEAVNALVPVKGLVLDLGCGDGAMGEGFDANRVVGFDISMRCARLARRRGVEAFVADAAAGVPLRDGVFDTVYCVDVLHHLRGSWERVFSELGRVLKAGGTLAIVEPDARNPFVRWTQAPKSPLRVAPCDDEPALYPEEVVFDLRRRGYAVQWRPIHIEGNQLERRVFPLWQRLLKAPFVAGLAFRYRRMPNKFAVIARKAG